MHVRTGGLNKHPPPPLEEPELNPGEGHKCSTPAAYKPQTTLASAAVSVQISPSMGKKVANNGTAMERKLPRQAHTYTRTCLLEEFP